MAKRPDIICAFPGCPRLGTHSVFCERHRDGGRRRDRARQALYGREWERESRAFLAERPWCEDCMQSGRFSPATEVHHRKKHAGDAALFWDRANWSGLCKRCHSRRTLRGE